MKQGKRKNRPAPPRRNGREAEERPEKHLTPAGAAREEKRRQEQARALRANLRRRKAQQRARAEARDARPATGRKPEDARNG